MEQELKKVFKNAKYGENPDLAENIWESIILYNKHTTRIKLWAFSFVGFVSLIGLIPAWKVLLSDLAKSGFYEYLSLLFSSGSSISSYWKELAFSIAESLPTTSIILSLSLVFVLFISFRYVIKQIIKGQLSLSF